MKPLEQNIITKMRETDILEALIGRETAVAKLSTLGHWQLRIADLVARGVPNQIAASIVHLAMLRSHADQQLANMVLQKPDLAPFVDAMKARGALEFPAQAPVAEEKPAIERSALSVVSR